MPESGLLFDAASEVGDFAVDASFSVDVGETLVLVGPSGAGKSTCLSLVAGLRRASRGRIVCGTEVWCDVSRGIHLEPEDRHVGLVFQDGALFPHLSVLQNVAYGPRARGRGRTEAERLAAEWIARLGLGALGARAACALSGGERQRVALARALATEPRALLLDEPFGALDVTTGGVVRAELRAFLAACALPVVLVTHDPVDALAFADRIAVLEGGRLSQAGTRDELLAAPRSAFVAELAGLNLYPVELAAGKGLKEARASGFSFAVLADELCGAGFVSFAPADVSLSLDRLLGSAQNSFVGRILEVRSLGDRLRVVIDAGAVIVAEVTSEAGASLGIEAGRPIWASIKALAIRVYG